jgi:long-chain acyl-CoA synthetase
VDEDGWLFLADRRSDLIISAGINIYPAEIEEGLLRHPAVAAVAAFGVPHAHFGEIVVAAVVLRSGAEPGDAVRRALREHCRAALPRHKRPHRIEFVAALPTTGAGKVSRRAVSDMYAHAVSRRKETS